MIKRLTAMNLKQKGALVVASFILLPLMALGYFAYWQASRVIETQVGSTMEQLVIQNHVTVDRVLNLIDENTIKIATDPVMKRTADDKFAVGGSPIADLLNKYSSLNIRQPLYALFVPVSDGEPAGERANRSVGLHEIDAAQMPGWYADSVWAAGSGGLRLIDDLGGFELGRRTLAYMRSVRDSAHPGSELGVLVVSQLEEVLRPDLEAIAALRGGQVVLVDHAYTVLAGNRTEYVGTKLALPVQAQGQSSGYAIAQEEGRSWLYAYHYSSSFNTRLVYKAPMDAITGQLKNIQYVNMVLTALYLLLVLVLVALLMRSVLRPLLQLIGFMKSYEPGKKLSPFPEPLRKDEIGYLSRSFRQMTERLDQLVEEKYVMELKGKEITLMALHSQITPHMLYNTLDSIYWFSRRGGMTEVAEMIRDLSRLLRIGLSRGRQIITLQEELEHVGAYVRLQLKRKKESFRIHYELAEQSLGCLVPKVMIQPLVENAILHGIAHMDGEGELWIRSELAGDTLRIAVEDNGFRPVDLGEMARLLDEDRAEETMDAAGEETESRPKGYGIRNVNRRIRLHYGDSYGLSYALRPGGGTIALLTLPVIRAREEGESPV